MLGRYERELSRLRDFVERKGTFTVAGISRELLIDYKAIGKISTLRVTPKPPSKRA